MKVYVVNYRNGEVMYLAGVFATLELAQKYLENVSADHYISDENGELVQGVM